MFTFFDQNSWHRDRRIFKQGPEKKQKIEQVIVPDQQRYSHKQREQINAGFDRAFQQMQKRAEGNPELKRLYRDFHKKYVALHKKFNTVRRREERYYNRCGCSYSQSVFRKDTYKEQTEKLARIVNKYIYAFNVAEGTVTGLQEGLERRYVNWQGLNYRVYQELPRFLTRQHRVRVVAAQGNNAIVEIAHGRNAKRFQITKYGHRTRARIYVQYDVYDVTGRKAKKLNEVAITSANGPFELMAKHAPGAVAAKPPTKKAPTKQPPATPKTQPAPKETKPPVQPAPEQTPPAKPEVKPAPKETKPPTKEQTKPPKTKETPRKPTRKPAAPEKKDVINKPPINQEVFGRWMNWLRTNLPGRTVTEPTYTGNTATFVIQAGNKAHRFDFNKFTRGSNTAPLYTVMMNGKWLNRKQGKGLIPYTTDDAAFRVIFRNAPAAERKPAPKPTPRTTPEAVEPGRLKWNSSALDDVISAFNKRIPADVTEIARKDTTVILDLTVGDTSVRVMLEKVQDLEGNISKVVYKKTSEDTFEHVGTYSSDKEAFDKIAELAPKSEEKSATELPEKNLPKKLRARGAPKEIDDMSPGERERMEYYNALIKSVDTFVTTANEEIKKLGGRATISVESRDFDGQKEFLRRWALRGTEYAFDALLEINENTDPMITLSSDREETKKFAGLQSLMTFILDLEKEDIRKRKEWEAKQKAKHELYERLPDPTIDGVTVERDKERNSRFELKNAKGEVIGRMYREEDDGQTWRVYANKAEGSGLKIANADLQTRFTEEKLALKLPEWTQKFHDTMKEIQTMIEGSNLAIAGNPEFTEYSIGYRNRMHEPELVVSFWMPVETAEDGKTLNEAPYIRVSGRDRYNYDPDPQTFADLNRLKRFIFEYTGAQTKEQLDKRKTNKEDLTKPETLIPILEKKFEAYNSWAQRLRGDEFATLGMEKRGELIREARKFHGSDTLISDARRVYETSKDEKIKRYIDGHDFFEKGVIDAATDRSRKIEEAKPYFVLAKEVQAALGDDYTVRWGRSWDDGSRLYVEKKGHRKHNCNFVIQKDTKGIVDASVTEVTPTRGGERYEHKNVDFEKFNPEITGKEIADIAKAALSDTQDKDHDDIFEALKKPAEELRKTKYNEQVTVLIGASRAADANTKRAALQAERRHLELAKFHISPDDKAYFEKRDARLADIRKELRDMTLSPQQKAFYAQVERTNSIPWKTPQEALKDTVTEEIGQASNEMLRLVRENPDQTYLYETSSNGGTPLGVLEVADGEIVGLVSYASDTIALLNADDLKFQDSNILTPEEKAAITSVERDERNFTFFNNPQVRSAIEKVQRFAAVRTFHNNVKEGLTIVDKERLEYEHMDAVSALTGGVVSLQYVSDEAFIEYWNKEEGIPEENARTFLEEYCEKAVEGLLSEIEKGYHPRWKQLEDTGLHRVYSNAEGYPAALIAALDAKLPEHTFDTSLLLNPFSLHWNSKEKKLNLVRHKLVDGTWEISEPTEEAPVEETPEEKPKENETPAEEKKEEAPAKEENKEEKEAPAAAKPDMKTAAMSKAFSDALMEAGKRGDKIPKLGEKSIDDIRAENRKSFVQNAEIFNKKVEDLHTYIAQEIGNAPESEHAKFHALVTESNTIWESVTSTIADKDFNIYLPRNIIYPAELKLAAVENKVREVVQSITTIVKKNVTEAWEKAIPESVSTGTALSFPMNETPGAKMHVTGPIGLELTLKNGKILDPFSTPNNKEIGTYEEKEDTIDMTFTTDGEFAFTLSYKTYGKFTTLRKTTITPMESRTDASWSSIPSQGKRLLEWTKSKAGLARSSSRIVHAALESYKPEVPTSGVALRYQFSFGPYWTREDVNLEHSLAFAREAAADGLRHIQGETYPQQALRLKRSLRVLENAGRDLEDWNENDASYEVVRQHRRLLLMHAKVEIGSMLRNVEKQLTQERNNRSTELADIEKVLERANATGDIKVLALVEALGGKDRVQCYEWKKPSGGKFFGAYEGDYFNFVSSEGGDFEVHIGTRDSKEYVEIATMTNKTEMLVRKSYLEAQLKEKEAAISGAIGAEYTVKGVRTRNDFTIPRIVIEKGSKSLELHFTEDPALHELQYVFRVDMMEGGKRKETEYPATFTMDSLKALLNEKL